MKRYNVLLMGVLLTMSVYSQTVNTGQLTVSPGTQFSTVGHFSNRSGATFTNDGEVFIYAEFNNDGLFEFTPGSSSLTRFEGSTVQSLSGTNQAHFYDVLFNNSGTSPAGFELSGMISVSHQADFTRGIVKNDDFGGVFQFENDAVPVHVSGESFVDGAVTKVGSASFDYPVGDSTLYRPASISEPASATDVFSARYFFRNPEAQHPLSKRDPLIEFIDNREYWEVKRESGSAEVYLTLSWDELTTPDTIISAAGHYRIHIVRWDPEQNKWIDEGGEIDYANKTVTTSNALTRFGIFTLARTDLAPGIEISEVFTPNGDGYNDTWLIKGLEAYPNSRVSIFNRWGTVVYETDDYQNDWNGTSNSPYHIGGEDLPEGTYYYLLELGKNLIHYEYSRKVSKGFLYLKRQ